MPFTTALWRCPLMTAGNYSDCMVEGDLRAAVTRDNDSADGHSQITSDSELSSCSIVALLIIIQLPIDSCWTIKVNIFWEKYTDTPFGGMFCCWKDKSGRIGTPARREYTTRYRTTTRHRGCRWVFEIIPDYADGHCWHTCRKICPNPTRTI